MPVYLTRVPTALIVLIVVLVGGVITITDPTTLPFDGYIRDVAIAVGLLAVGHGLDKNSTP